MVSANAAFIVCKSMSLQIYFLSYFNFLHIYYWDIT